MYLKWNEVFMMQLDSREFESVSIQFLNSNSCEMFTSNLNVSNVLNGCAKVLQNYVNLISISRAFLFKFLRIQLLLIYLNAEQIAFIDISTHYKYVILILLIFCMSVNLNKVNSLSIRMFLY